MKLAKTKAEFRIKEEGVNWEDTPVIDMVLDVPENNVWNAIHLVAEQMAVNSGKQVRWNYYGHLKGFYTR
ncbi:hypothetical protein [Bacillus cereus]|uniref:hypothetical protein n=1 Tax=Bacillus cereus group TaxID=86661 RepID=UPI00240494CC|nr:hypothetical protein [Bacillus cereus]MDF9530613.1 hypothetical protein [Bacillus cereus]MDG1578887.1 hypothetical protein [Bacillus cereus]